LRHEVFAGPESALEHVGEERFNNGLAALATVAIESQREFSSGQARAVGRWVLNHILTWRERNGKGIL
jgi:hypothetical protein